MKLGTMLSDGSPITGDLELDVEIVDKDGNPYADPVSVHCRYIGQKERREIEASCQRFVKDQKTRGMRQETDWMEVAALTSRRAVISWTGITGADDKPLAVTEESKAALPPHVLLQITQAVTDAEADLTSASFRESAAVV